MSVFSELAAKGMLPPIRQNSGNHQFPEPKAVWPQPEDFGEAEPSSLGSIEYVEDMGVRPGRILVVAAEEGAGKSYAIDGELGIRLAAAGGSFAETWRVLSTCGVLVLSEMHRDDDIQRRDRILAALDLERRALRTRYFRLDLATAAQGTPALDSADWRAAILAWSRVRGVVVHVYDTASGATASNPWGQDIQAVYRNLRLMLADYPELAIILIVHCKKPNGHGSRRITDVIGEWGRWCDGVMMLEDAGADHVKLSTFKRVRRPRRIVVRQRDGLLVEPKDVAAGQTKVPKEQIASVLAANPGIAAADLGKRLGVSKATAARYIKETGVSPSHPVSRSDETGDETLVRQDRLTSHPPLRGETERETASGALEAEALPW